MQVTHVQAPGWLDAEHLAIKAIESSKMLKQLALKVLGAFIETIWPTRWGLWPNQHSSQDPPLQNFPSLSQNLLSKPKSESF
jgi:hypothetical protein